MDEGGINLTEHQEFVIILIHKIISGISIVSSILIILIFWFFREIRNFKLESAVWMSVSNLLYDLSAFLPYDNHREGNRLWCCTQAFATIWFQTASKIWACIIGYFCFISVIRRHHLERNKKWYRILFVLLSFLISASLASMYIYIKFSIIFTDTYGPTGGWCWLDVYRKQDTKKLVLKLTLSYYALCWFFIILNSFFIFKVIYILREHKKEVVLLEIYHKLKWIPVASVICTVPSTISRVNNIISDEPSFILIMLQAIFGSAMGLFCLIIYIRLPNVKNAIFTSYQRFKMRKDQKHETSIYTLNQHESLLS